MAGGFSEEMLGVRKKGDRVERWLFNGAFLLSQGSPGAIPLALGLKGSGVGKGRTLTA